jgi:hypothetical protein
MNYLLFIFKDGKFIEMESTEARSKRLGVTPNALRLYRARDPKEAEKGVLIDNRFYYYKDVKN